MVTIILIGLAVVGTAVGGYLFLRNNPKKASKVDSFVNDVKNKL